jgi:hypothetical protein
MTRNQRITYIQAAQAAHKELQSQLDIDEFRHEEVDYALGISSTTDNQDGCPTRKGFQTFDPFDLTKCLVHFWSLANDGVRLTPEKIALKALERVQFRTTASGTHAPPKYISVRQAWDACASQQRGTAVGNRHQITFYEEVALLEYDEIKKLFWMLDRIAVQHPSNTSKAKPVTTATETVALPKGNL